MSRYKKSCEGNKFALTELGLEKNYVRVKFDICYEQYKIYQHRVPTAWVEKGYVKEIKDSGKDESKKHL